MLTHGIRPDFRGGVHLFILNRHTPSGQSRVYGVTQLRTNGVHCGESASTGPVVLTVVPVTGAAFAGYRKPNNGRFCFPTPTIGIDISIHSNPTEDEVLWIFNMIHCSISNPIRLEIPTAEGG